jgi:hypothetical protein
VVRFAHWYDFGNNNYGDWFMSEYSIKLASIAAKKQKLLAEETKLIEKRKKEISATMERLGLLMVSDEIITGLFLEAAKAINENTDKLKEWESEGARFLKSKKQHTQVA